MLGLQTRLPDHWPAAARCAPAIAERLRTRQPPFTQVALDRWLDDVLAGVDVSEFMSADL